MKLHGGSEITNRESGMGSRTKLSMMILNYQEFWEKDHMGKYIVELIN